MSNKPSIIFFGTPEFAVPSLQSLIDAGFNILAVVTTPDKPTGKKQILTPSPIKELALKNNLTVLQPKTLKDDAFFEQFKTLNPDLCVIVAYGKIVPQRYIDTPKFGFINVHPSLLPKYRGASPIQSSILAGETETGVSIMLIDAEVDHGPLLYQSFTIPMADKYYPELAAELSQIGARSLVKAIEGYVSGEVKPEPQDHTQATFTKMFQREDGKIDWSKPAQEIYNQIRALNPEPGTWTTYQGKNLNITKAHLNNNALVIDRLQLEGKKEMSRAEFTNGHHDFDESVLRSEE